MVSTKRVSGAAARRATNREHMHAAILDTARSIVTDNGTNSLTIRGVAQALNYSPGAIYEYFESKEEILTCLYFQGTSGLGAQMEQAIADLPAGTDAVNGMMALARAYRAHALANRELYRLVFGGMTDTPEPPAIEHADQQAGGFGTLIGLAAQGVAEGSMVDIPVPLIAHAAWAAVHGFVSLELQGHIVGADAPGMPVPSDEDGLRQRDQMFETVIRMMLFGLVTEGYRATTPDPFATLGRPVGPNPAMTG